MSSNPRVWIRVRQLPWAGLLMLPVVGLLWQSFFWLDRVPLLTKICYAGVAVLSAARPAAGLLVIAALASLGSPFADLVGAPHDRTAEALMLAFLVGWLCRGVVRREPVLDRDDTLAPPLALFGLAVAASLVVTSVAVQSASSPPWDYIKIAGTLLARNYLGWEYFETHNWYSAALLFEGGLLCAAVLQITRRRPELQVALARMLVVGVVAVALFSLARVATGLMRTADPLAYAVRMLTAVRLGAHTADVNAAGSHFVLVLPLLWSLGRMAGRWRPAWIASAIPVVAALWLTGSRAAQFSLVLLVAVALAVSGRRRSVARIVVVAMALVVVVGAVIVSRPGPESSIVATLNNRWLFSKLSWDMFTSAPVFGIGISEYYVHSEAVMPAALRVLYVAENAHNNFAQIGVELGVVGLGLFLAVFVSAWQRIRRAWSSTSDRVLEGCSLGILAALLTFLVGHPLLIGVFVCSFWLTLALAVSRADSLVSQPPVELSSPVSSGHQHSAGWSPRTVAAVALVLILSVPVRAHLARDNVNLSNVRFGFAPGGIDAATKDAYRWAGPTATLFVTTRAQTLLLSVSPESEADPVEVELRIDGRLANRVVLRDAFWRDMRLIMPVNGSSNPFWRIDVIVTRLAGEGPTGSAQAHSAGPRIRVRTIMEK